MAAIALQLHLHDQVDCARGVITLYPRPEAYEVWGRLAWDDEIVLFSFIPKLKIYVATVSGKNLINTSDTPLLGRQRLIVETTKISSVETKVFDLGILSSLQTGAEISTKALRNIKDSLKFTDHKFTSNSNLDVLFPYRIDTRTEITLAQTKEAINFVKRVATEHPFGESQGSIRLVLRVDDHLVGASVVKLAFETNRRHDGELRAFGRDSAVLRRSSIFIARLHSSKGGHVRQRHYEWLLRAITYMSPNVYAEPISYISGVSYDFIPAAFKAGFSVDIPRRKFGSFFYWKPIFANLTRPMESWKDLKEAYKGLKRERGGQAWLVSADRKRLAFAADHGKWAISDNAANRGRWRAVRPGDVIFFCAGGQFVIGAGRVSRAERMQIPGFERYPLGFQLSGVSALKGQISLDHVFSPEWLANLKIGALAELPEEGHYALMDEFENAKAGGRMWVRPNPYLLRRTQFSVTPRRAFIVQAWDLRETIYPIVKKICEGAGWTVSHSSDREGQAIFDDIWVMLNECEAVVVDFTRRRPNVYLEYGMALVLGKPVIALTQDEADLPSDTPNLKFKKYRGDANAFMDLSDKLPRSLVDTIEDVQRANEAYDHTGTF